MKFVIFICLSVVCAWTTVFAKADLPDIPQGSLTLDQAFKTALARNPDILEAKARIESARAVVKQARSAYLPTVSLTGNVKAIDATIQPDWMPTYRLNESYNETGVGLGLTWLIFDGFAREANALAANYGVEQRKQMLAETRRLLLKAVATAFYQAQLAVEGMVVARENQQFNQVLERDSRIRWEVGTVPEAEMLNFSVKALQAESDFLTAQRDFKIVKTVLAQLMGLPGALLPPNLYPVRISKGQRHPPDSFDADYQFALEHRPDLKALDQGALALDQRLRAQKGANSPTIALVSGADYLFQDDITVIDQEEHDTYVGIVASWDLYTGGRTSGKIEAVNAQIRALDHQRQGLLLSISSAIHQSRDRADTAFETYERQNKTLELTRRIRDHVETAYRAGTLPLTRLNQAQTDLVRASGAVAFTWIDYQIALVNLMAETGRLDNLE
ncbi:MdtQ [Desulforapulum autotrophicum HRM2]|uniref:MdtQ n=1 Tax=Desulforapulum autotrophicum (strain ATCC 43914 / DSM 3382 / VKM B-1955 / HRM2) TaxID=177437 RepID=C0QMG2_DESAH|nr:TolC family protein [Desulforapulum autotrophicum]ACN16479.1 MdtQ [Desulforapulum autotrophicum HRM2]